MRILVVEDEVKIRKGIASLINRHTEHTVIGEAKNGVEGYEMALRHLPEVVDHGYPNAGNGRAFR